jgi:hypothetical protein
MEATASTREAARCLGIAVSTFYSWLGQSKRGLLRLRGQVVWIRYYQGGALGQGRIRIDLSEIQRLKGLLEVQPQPHFERRAPARRTVFPGIVVPLGRPTRS